MKSLTLLRHAKSSWKNARLPDLERPLSKRGLRDAPRMGKRLARRRLEPDLLLSSPATRARQTAEFVAAAFGEPKLAIELDPDIYLASPGELLRLLAGVNDAIGALILVGHNPGLTRLANMMLSDLALDNLPTAGAVAIDCDTDCWQNIKSAHFRLNFYDFPKNSEALN